MKKPLFIKRVDMDKWREAKKDNPGACLVSEYDLGYRGLFGIQWGWWKCRFDMWWMSFRITHLWASNLHFNLRRMRFKFYSEGNKMMLKDRLTGEKREVGRFA